MITATVGIDAGTSSGRGVLVDLTERWARHAVHRPPGLYREFSVLSDSANRK